MEENCQNCFAFEGAFVGCCYIPWCSEKDEFIVFPEKESCYRFKKTIKNDEAVG